MTNTIGKCWVCVQFVEPLRVFNLAYPFILILIVGVTFFKYLLRPLVIVPFNN